MARINRRTIKVSPSDQYVMENRSYLDLIKEYESIAKINIEVKAKKRIINRPIFCYVNGKPYDSLCEALRQHGISLDKKTSPWFKINRELKKHSEYQHGKLKFSLPK